MEYEKKRTWAEISLSNIQHNYKAIRNKIPAGTKFLGVVKADAYGHGALRVSRLLEAEGADYLAVSCLDEAVELRAGGITMPILILGHTPAEFTDVLLEQNLTQTVTCLAKAKEYSEACKDSGKKLKIHIKVDTGMSRLGFLVSGESFEEGVAHMKESCLLPGIEPEGIYTHFSVSDEPGEENREYTLSQFRLFMRVINALTEEGILFRIRHCANSGAVVNYPEMCLDMVRPGFLLYGYGDTKGLLSLKPAMRLLTTIGTIKYYEPGTAVSYGRHYITSRRTRMAVLSLGYADGLPRAASGKCSFYTKGSFGPQCGSVCMDMCMMDVTGIYAAEVGSEVEIFGEHASLEKLAGAAYTIPYEILCSVTKRVPRIYCE